MIDEIVQRLTARYGPPDPPVITDPFQQIVWEAVCYLADDDKRAVAFEALRSRVGLTAEAIAAAPSSLLEEVSCGMRPADRATRLKEIAWITLDEHGGDLTGLTELPTREAIKALTRFPGIGKPGAAKILLFAGGHPTLALDSNGLRVLLRVGIAREGKSYDASYRAVQVALEPDVPDDARWLVAAHVLLRRHGKETCRRSTPECGSCPLRDICAHSRR